MPSPSPRPAPCGTWSSPLTAAAITGASLRFGDLVADGADLYWTEARLEDKGRSIIVRRRGDGRIEDLTPEGFGVRTLVNSYGGVPFSVAGGEVFFSAYRAEGVPAPWDRHRDQRLYRQRPGSPPEILADPVGSYWADAAMDAGRGRLILVREDQTHLLHGQPMQTLSAVDLSGERAPEVLVMGDDFYAYPRLSPDGRRLAWLSWRYPDMPWDSAEVWLAEVGEGGALTGHRRIAGGPDEAAMQPTWTPEGALLFASDRTGWWNLYRLEGDEIVALHPRAAEFSEPLWGLGSSRFVPLRGGRIACTWREDGRWKLGLLDSDSGALRELPNPYTEIYQLVAGDGFLAFCAGGPHQATALIRLDLATGAQERLRVATTLDVDAIRPWLSTPEPITFPTRDGETARAFFYRPRNPDARIPDGERPPLIVRSHGGPTGWASTGLTLPIHYFTSRGFAVVDVDYRGSAGYGRAYRQCLYGHWGERDIEDCADAALYLIAQGEADGSRVVAAGGSAGGYITLGLVAFTDLCRAGVSYYGISSLEMIVQHSDKLEAFYPYKLIGPWPEAADLYRARSPLHRVDEVSCPVLFFQGLEDPVVPPAQTRAMVTSLQARGVPVAAVYFEGEQHGFRDMANVRRSLEGELSFYAQVLGFELADEVEGVEIEGLTPADPRRR